MGIYASCLWPALELDQQCCAVWKLKCEKYKCSEPLKGPILGSNAKATESPMQVGAIKTSLLDK